MFILLSVLLVLFSSFISVDYDVCLCLGQNFLFQCCWPVAVTAFQQLHRVYQIFCFQGEVQMTHLGMHLTRYLQNTSRCFAVTLSAYSSFLFIYFLQLTFASHIHQKIKTSPLHNDRTGTSINTSGNTKKIKPGHHLTTSNKNSY